MSVEQEVLVEIRRLRDQVPGVLGSLVASFDGLLVADDTAPGMEPTGLAALAAAGLGLGQRIAASVYHGDLSETVVTATSGHVATYAAGNRVLFTVVASATTNIALLHIEARQVAERVAAIVEVLDVEDRDDLFERGVDDRAAASMAATLPGMARPHATARPGKPAGTGLPRRGEPALPDLPHRNEPAQPDLPRRNEPARSDLPRRGEPAPSMPRRRPAAAG